MSKWDSEFGWEVEFRHEERRAQRAKLLTPPQPAQEPVAWGVFEGNLHDMFFTQGEAQEMAALKGSHAEVRPLYTTPPAAQPATEKSSATQPVQEPVGPEPFGYFQYDIRLDAWVQNRINNKGVAFYTKEKP